MSDESFIELFGDFDTALEPLILETKLHKGTVLAVTAVLRDVVRQRNPKLAERLILTRCEAAPQNFAQP